MQRPKRYYESMKFLPSNLAKVTKIKLGIPFIAVLAGSVCFAGTVAAPYQIGLWEGFRPAAISYTFDDDLPNQYVLAVPMFHTAGFKLTLFTVSSWVLSWPTLKTAASYNDEIASHTVTHVVLTSVSGSQLITELSSSQTAINQNITNQQCLTIAYPNCVVPNETTVAQYYFAGRGCSGQIVPSTPSDFFNISSFVLGNQGLLNISDINNEATAAFNQNGWCVYLIHALDSDSGYSPLPSATLQASVNYMSTNQNKFWVETFGNVVRYIKERNASSVAETSNTGNSITVQVTNSLDKSIYNYPITIRRPLPAGWPAAAVSQNNNPISTQVVVAGSTILVMFDVVPNGGDVVISETASAPVLSNPVLTPPSSLTISLGGQSNANYAIYSSTDLLNWFPIQTNMMGGTYTNFTVTPSNSMQFYRAQWVP
jgi:hypothetical protein